MGRFEEILVVVFVVLLLFGAPKLPELGKGLGKAIKEFRDAVSGKTETKDEDKKKDA